MEFRRVLFRSLSYYLQPFQNRHSFNFYASSPLYHDPSFSAPHEFTISEESQISFSSPYDQDANMVNGSHVSRSWYALPSARAPLQQDSASCKFTLTHVDKSRENRAVIKPSSPLPRPKQNCRAVDLQLGLSLHSTIWCFHLEDIVQDSFYSLGCLLYIEKGKEKKVVKIYIIQL